MVQNCKWCARLEFWFWELGFLRTVASGSGVMVVDPLVVGAGGRPLLSGKIESGRAQVWFFGFRGFFLFF